MKKLKYLFTVPENEKVTEKHMMRVLISTVCSVLLCMTCLVSTTWAWYTVTITSEDNLIKTGTWGDDTQQPSSPVINEIDEADPTQSTDPTEQESTEGVTEATESVEETTEATEETTEATEATVEETAEATEATVEETTEVTTEAATTE